MDASRISATRQTRATRKSAAKPKAKSTGLRRASKITPVLKQFRELFRVSQQHFQRIETDCGVSGAQVWALSELEARPGQRISELAQSLSVHLSTASNLLDKLEAKNLVRRERTSSDQRVVKVYLTPEGRRVVSRAPRPAEGVIPDALRKMPEEALRRLHRDLEQLLELTAIRNPRAALKPLAEP